jgi:CelD/BcsL family acetyltransferase involved in cellulose biosynthesis
VTTRIRTVTFTLLQHVRAATLADDGKKGTRAPYGGHQKATRGATGLDTRKERYGPGVNAPQAETVLIDPRSDPRWRQLAIGSLGSVFTSPPWISAVCATYGFTPAAIIRLDWEGQPRAGLAWVPINDLRGDRLSSLPFSDRAEPLTSDQVDWKTLVEGIITDTAPLTLRCLDTTVAASDARFREVAAAAWHGTPLDGGVEAIYRRLSQHARRNIGISEREGVRIEARTDRDAVHRFHRLHVSLRKRKYRLLAQPVELFDYIWDAFAPNDAIVTMLAHAGDTLIAGAIFLVWGDTLYYKFGASLHEHLALRPNDAIFWAGICWAVQRGAHLLDWGLSDLDQPGLITYKRKWATKQRRIVTLRAGGEHARSNTEAGPMLSELTKLFTDDSVPDEVTRKAGALLYRYFC